MRVNTRYINSTRGTSSHSEVHHSSRLLFFRSNSLNTPAHCTPHHTHTHTCYWQVNGTGEGGREVWLAGETEFRSLVHGLRDILKGTRNEGTCWPANTGISVCVGETLKRDQELVLVTSHLYICNDDNNNSGVLEHRFSHGGGDSSVLRAPDSWLKGHGFESLQERRDNFLIQGRLSVLTLISVSVAPPCYRSSA